VCTDVVQVVFMVAILTYLEPLVLLVAGPFALPYLVVRWRTGKVRSSEDIEWTTKRRWTRYFALHLTGNMAPAETKVLGLGTLFLAQWRALLSQFRDRDRKRYWRDFRDAGIFATLTTLAFYALFVRIVWQAANGVLTVGDIAVFAAVTARLRLTLEHLISSSSSVAQQAGWITNLRGFLEMSPRMTATGTRVPTSRRGEIELIGVSFTYPHAITPAVSGVSLHINAGEVVALVGENGAGKTTLVRLLARLYDPDQGGIHLDGVDLREWPLEELHASIAFLDQRFGRFEATAAENIAYGDWRRLMDDPERIRDIALSAGADELIRRMPHGYDTRLGPMFGTHDLSSGQWQKLAVARAVARNAPVLIIDEPTAHLDAATEYDIFCRLRDLARGRTTILVSHRFTTLGLADRIVVMDQGRLVENGTHEELVAHGGVYARLYDLSQRQAARRGTR
jgi:ATP-binding cassette subfamily B protein